MNILKWTKKCSLFQCPKLLFIPKTKWKVFHWLLLINYYLFVPLYKAIFEKDATFCDLVFYDTTCLTNNSEIQFSQSCKSCNLSDVLCVLLLLFSVRCLLLLFVVVAVESLINWNDVSNYMIWDEIETHAIRGNGEEKNRNGEKERTQQKNKCKNSLWNVQKR